MSMRKHFALRALKMVVIAIVALTVLGFVTMALWNWLMPVLFGLKTIGFLQALGLVILSKILFGGFRGHGGPFGGRRQWFQRMEERWKEMTPEERQKFREGMRTTWCRDEAAEPKA